MQDFASMERNDNALTVPEVDAMAPFRPPEDKARSQKLSLRLWCGEAGQPSHSPPPAK